MALDTTEGAISLFFGLVMLVFHRSGARFTVMFYESLKMRAAGERVYRAAYLVGGLVFTFIGLLGLGLFG